MSIFLAKIHFNEIFTKSGQNRNKAGKISEEVKFYHKVTSCGKISMYLNMCNVEHELVLNRQFLLLYSLLAAGMQTCQSQLNILKFVQRPGSTKRFQQ